MFPGPQALPFTVMLEPFSDIMRTILLNFQHRKAFLSDNMATLLDVVRWLADTWHKVQTGEQIKNNLHTAQWMRPRSRHWDSSLKVILPFKLLPSICANGQWNSTILHWTWHWIQLIWVNTQTKTETNRDTSGMRAVVHCLSESHWRNITHHHLMTSFWKVSVMTISSHQVKQSYYYPAQHSRLEP